MSYRRSLSYLGVLLAVGLIIWLVIGSDLTLVFNEVKRFDIPTLFLLIGLQIITILLISWQWQLLFAASTITLGFKSILMMNFVGTFFESITPAMKSGGEGFKLVYLKRLSVPFSASSPVLLVQKTISFSIFLLLTVLSFLVMVPRLEADLRQLIFVIILSLFVLISLFIVGSFVLLRKRTQSKHLHRFKHAFHVLLSSLRQNPYKTLLLVFISVLIWSLFALKLHLVLGAFAINTRVFESAFITYIPYAVGLLPLSPGGLGTFEATMTYLLYPRFSDYSIAVSITLIFRFISHWIVFILALIYISIARLFKRSSFYE